MSMKTYLTRINCPECVWHSFHRLRFYTNETVGGVVDWMST